MDESANRRRTLFYVLLALSSLALEAALAGPAVSAGAERWKRETRDDAGDDSYDWRADAKDVVEEWSEDALDWWETIWGGKCVEGSDVCSAVSYCHVQDEKFDIVGECRMTWWFLLVLAAIAALIIGSLLSCICCPCCCLYKTCRACCECLCCCGCCRSGGRYSLAGS